MNIINTANQTFMNDPGAPQKVAEKYDLLIEDAAAWFSQTLWATDSKISEQMLEEVMKTLYELGSIVNKPSLSQLHITI